MPALVANVKGLLRLEIAESILVPGSFIFYEEWTDEEAPLKHSQEQYVIDFFEQIDPLLAEPHHYMVGILKNGDEE